MCFFYSEYLEEVRLAYMHRTRTERASIKIPTAQEENDDDKNQSELDLDHLSLGKELLDSKPGSAEECPDKASDWDIPAQESRQAMLEKLKVGGCIFGVARLAEIFLQAIHTNAHLRCQPPPFHIVEMCVNEAPTATFRQFCCVFLRSQELCELLRNAHNSQRDLLLKEAVIPAVCVRYFFV